MQRNNIYLFIGLDTFQFGVTTYESYENLMPMITIPENEIKCVWRVKIKPCA